MSQTPKPKRQESEEPQSFFDFDDYDNVIGFLISQAADVLVKQLEQIFQAGDVSLTPREFAMLNRLAQYGELTQIELSELTYKDPPSTSRIVESLRRKQLVRRKTSKSDRRSTDISLTEKGREVRDRAADCGPPATRHGRFHRQGTRRGGHGAEARDHLLPRAGNRARINRFSLKA
jgi:DNA-binding MarR family transcriptional regulator